MPENAAKQTSKRIREASQRILAARFELILRLVGLALFGNGLALGG